MVFNATFNNISAIWRWLVLSMEVPGVHGKTTDLRVPQVTDKLYPKMLYRLHIACVGFELTKKINMYNKIFRNNIYAAIKETYSCVKATS